MKKKLIAAVTSLVMVATMVPATVSATTGGAAPAAAKAAQTKADTQQAFAEISLATSAELEGVKDGDAEMINQYKEISKQNLNTGVSGTAGETLTLTGSVPYVKGMWKFGGFSKETDYISAGAEVPAKKISEGNYIATQLEANAGTVAADHWAYAIESESQKSVNEPYYIVSGAMELASKGSVINVTRLVNKDDIKITVYYFQGASALQVNGEAITSDTKKFAAPVSVTGAAATKTVTINKSGLALESKEQADSNVQAKAKQEVLDAIKALPAPGSITSKDKTAIEAARTAYNKYMAAYPGYDAELAEALKTLSAAEKALADAQDKAAAAAVIEQIKAIATTLTKENLDKTEQAKITAAEEAYKNLSDAEKKAVSNYSDLVNAKAAAEAVNLIDGNKVDISTTNYNTLETKGKVNAIKTVVADLEKNNPAALARVGNYNVYEKMVEDIAAFEKKVADVDVLLQELSKITKVEANQAEIDKAQAQLNAVQTAVDELEVGLKDDLKLNSTTTIKAVQDLIDEAQAKVDNQKAADEIIALINKIPATVELADMATVDMAVTAYTDSDKLVIKNAVTLALNPENPDVAALIPQELKEKLEKAEEALKAKVGAASEEEFTAAFIKAYGSVIPANPTQADEKIVALAHKALDTYKNNFNTSDPAYVALKNKIVGAVNTIDALKDADLAALNAVVALLDPFFAESDPWKMETIKATDRPDIEKARKAYDALTEAQKALDKAPVDKLGKQTVKKALEAVEEALKAADEALPNQQAAEQIIIAIKNLPAADKLTIADKEKVEAVAKQYEDATKAVKDKIDELDATAKSTLDAAVNKINELVAGEMIKKIDTLKELTGKEDKAAIDEAVTALKAVQDEYNTLSDAVKKKVTNQKKLDSVAASISVAKVAYTDAQIAEAIKISLETITDEQAAKLETVNDLINNWLTKEEAAKLEAKNAAAFDTLYAAYTKTAKDLEKAAVTAIADQAYTGSAVKPAVEVKNAYGKVVPADAYKVTYQNNTKVGTASVLIAPTTEGGYTGSITAEFKIKAASIAKATVTGVVSKTYTGKALTQKVVVKANGKTLKNGTDYTVSYKNNKNVGKATVTVKAKGNYTGTITKTFIVKPAKESITSLKKGTKRFTVKYKKQSGAKYQIYYKTAGSKAKTVKTSAVTKTVKNLKKGKTYTVKVRAYKAIDGKTYYGAYSKAKKVKVR